MTPTMFYNSSSGWRFGIALGAAVIIHLAALGFANGRKIDPASTPGSGPEPPQIVLVPDQPQPDQLIDPLDPLPNPPTIDQFYREKQPAPPPVRLRVANHATPSVKQRSNMAPGSLNLPSAKVLALNAPRPEYPFQARRQKITGDGVAVMRVDPVSGNVTEVAIVKSTGNAFLDDAATAGFRRWRFKPGTVSSVTCPITFTLNGASY